MIQVPLINIYAYQFDDNTHMPFEDAATLRSHWLAETTRSRPLPTLPLDFFDIDYFGEFQNGYDLHNR